MWDGTERRKETRLEPELRDKIIETHNDVKHLIEWSKTHTKDDDNRFDIVRKEIEVGKKFLWGGAGILAAVEFIGKFIK